MSELREYPQGTPCWVELSVHDRTAAVAFYGAVFGWEFAEPELQYHSYSTIFKHGKAVAGLIVPGGHVPVAWTTYLASDDSAATARAIGAYGGRVLVDVMKVPGEGRMLVATDPTGVVFGAWEGERGTRGSEVVNEPGAPIWNELVTPNAARARPFYSAVFGIAISPRMSAEFDYTTIRVADRDVGGIWQPADRRRPGWSVYFGTADTDATAAAVARAGGRILRAPTDSPYGRMATFADPQGGEFAVMSVRS